MMEKKNVVRLYPSLHYVIDVCHIHYSAFISPFITPTNEKKRKERKKGRAYFIHNQKKKKEFLSTL